jgi:hypothetical protein
MLCAMHGFTSGPILTYGRSVLSEISMLGYEGYYVGLTTAASLLLSLVTPSTMEAVTRHSSNGHASLGNFFVWPFFCFMCSQYMWYKKVSIKNARDDNKTYIQKINVLNARKDEFRQAIALKKDRARIKEEQSWKDNSKHFMDNTVHNLGKYKK